MRTLVIVPAYNEAGSIKNVIEKIENSFPEGDCIVINDCSSDDTVRVLEEADADYVSLPVNLGLAGAFQTGIRYAFENGYDAAVQIDGDGQHEPAYLREMISLLESDTADIVIGSRFLKEKKPFNARMFGSRALSFAIRTTTGERITDPTSGMRAYNRKMMELISENINFGPEPDTVAFLIRHGAKVEETQVTMYERETGTSYLTFSKSIRYMINMYMSILFIQFFRREK